MSVTFEPSTTEFPAVWGITCYAKFDETDRPEFIGGAHDYQGALEVRSTHMATCESCTVYGCYTTSQPVGVGEIPSVNVANGNAGQILLALHLDIDDVEIVGSADADDFLGRVLVALAVEPEDTGIESVSYRARSGRTVEVMGDVATSGEGATFTDCGRPAGYLQHRLEGLREVAEWARAHGTKVVWA